MVKEGKASCCQSAPCGGSLATLRKKQGIPQEGQHGTEPHRYSRVQAHKGLCCAACHDGSSDKAFADILGE